MIDFKNATYLKLKRVPDTTFFSLLAPILVPEEGIVSTYQSIRDGVVFTNKRIIAINIQGLTGTKKDITSMPYSKVQVYSVETAGILDLDSELEIWFSGVGKVRFEFKSNANVSEICRLMSLYVLK
jgi:hypothetical protein